MPSLYRTAAAATDLACGVVGRRNVVRATRFALRRARRDVPNDLHTNGESSLQRWALGLSPADREIHIIDVGANIGRWSVSMIATARQAGRLENLDLHVFEPCSYTFARLAETLAGHSVSLHQIALSEQSGRAALHVIAPGAGTNSLYAPVGSGADRSTERVTTTTLESYAGRAGLDHITLVKIDTEGHDLAVLRGARMLFAQHRISTVQFEYNQRWVDARSFLRDAFELLEPLGYGLGKLTPWGVEFYPGWDAELETFVEGNYIAAAPGVVDRMPSVVWWKSDR